MFIDEAQIHVKAGDGGKGCVAFRREKYIPKGGPEGGDGGDGGSVIFVADSSVNTLMEFSGRHNWNAQRGQDGMGKRMAGKDGQDLLVKVPAGTIIRDSDHGIVLADNRYTYISSSTARDGVQAFQYGPLLRNGKRHLDGLAGGDEQRIARQWFRDPCLREHV